MPLKLRNRYLIPAAAALALVPGAIAAVPAGAAGKQTVKCVGNGWFCGATVSLAGGASNKQVTINLTDTDFVRAQVRVTPGSSRGAFSITKASFAQGGSVYRFTLNAVKANPKNAKIILLFATGKRA
jgi:hypothetical protein